jgi:hypothetical protein
MTRFNEGDRVVVKIPAINIPSRPQCNKPEQEISAVVYKDFGGISVHVWLGDGLSYMEVRREWLRLVQGK